MNDRYPTPQFRRTALAPGILGAIVLLAGLALIGSSTYIVIQYATSILALIIVVFAYQARQWWWIPLLLAVAVIWNPVFPVYIAATDLPAFSYVATLVFILTAVFIRVLNTEDRNAR
jgi:hypothetical protein